MEQTDRPPRTAQTWPVGEVFADGLLVDARFDGTHDAGRLARSLRRHHGIPVMEQALDETLAESATGAQQLGCRRAYALDACACRAEQVSGESVGDIRSGLNVSPRRPRPTRAACVLRPRWSEARQDCLAASPARRLVRYQA